MYDEDWGYVLKSEPQTLRQIPNFFRCLSTNTLQQAGGKMKREELQNVCNVGV